MVQRYRQSVGVDFAPLQDEVILFHPSSSKFCVLNRTSTFIWSQLKEPASKEELAERLRSSFGGVDLQRAISDVDAALQQMLSLKLIVDADPSNHAPELTQ